MQIKRYTFIFVIWSVLFLSLSAAQAQTAINYRFLEVVDTAGKPVVDAKVETFQRYDLGGRPQSTQQTDHNGTIRKLPVWIGDTSTSGLKVSKPGYFTYEDERAVNDSDGIWIQVEIPQYDPDGPIKIQLFKIPTTVAERKAIEVEQQKRELLLATKRGDAATVRRLLQAGLNANTTDVHGIPLILWAVTNFNVETIKALLAAGADVRSTDKPGRNALLYYMYYAYQHQIDEEVVRSLIEGGADVKAVNTNGETVLTYADHAGAVKIITLLESAGAQRKRQM